MLEEFNFEKHKEKLPLGGLEANLEGKKNPELFNKTGINYSCNGKKAGGNVKFKNVR